jgi:serine/threonine-protein kinase
VPGYTLRRRLGGSGGDALYEGVHDASSARVAVRIIDPSRARGLVFVDRFREEAAQLKAISHPQLAALRDAGHIGPTPFVVTEFVDGSSAAEVARRGPVAEAQGVRVIRAVAAGLAHANGFGRLHRDLKSTNVFIGPPIKVTDLGIAHLGGDEMALAQQRDPHAAPSVYMPPEQLFHGQADRTADIYALGAVLYELLTGRVPFAADSVAEMLVNKQGAYLADPRRVVPKLSDGCVRVLDRMLAQEPEHRYAEYADLLADLDAVLDGRPPATPELPEDQSSFDWGGIAEMTTAQAAAEREVAPEPKGVPAWIWAAAAAAAATAAWFLLT